MPTTRSLPRPTPPAMQPFLADLARVLDLLNVEGPAASLDTLRRDVARSMAGVTRGTPHGDLCQCEECAR